MPRPTISLIHTTARPDKWLEACRKWFDYCDNPADVEYCLCYEASKGAYQLEKIPFNHTKLQPNTGRPCLVDGFNSAAAISTGTLLVLIADDFVPTGDHWDSQLLAAVPSHVRNMEAFIWPSTSSESDAYICIHPIITRTYYNRYGYWFYPKYHSVFADNEKFELAQRDDVIYDIRDKLNFDHQHPMFNKREGDAVYTANLASWGEDERLYNQRKKEGFPGTMKNFVVLDVGCRLEPCPLWNSLPGLKVIGWDVDAEECRRLQELYPAHTFIGSGLWSCDGILNFYNTGAPSCSSFAKPLPDSKNISWEFREDAVSTASVKTLDSFQADYFPNGADLLKIDTQGTELEVLKGATEALKSVLVVELEVEFNPFYEGQPLFGHIDSYLRSMGFQFYDFRELNRYSKKYHQTQNEAGTGQLNWANAYFIPNPVRNPERTKVLMNALGFPTFGE